MIEKRLRGGRTAYYWNAPNLFLKAGFTLHREPLGQDYATAVNRANELNQHLDAWRTGRSAIKDLDLQPGFGTLGWLVERYMRSRAWENVSARSRPGYEDALEMVLKYKLRTGQDLRHAPVAAMSARGVDQLYGALQKGKRVKRRLRTANLCMIKMARAWDVVQRLYPTVVPAANPFRGVELEHGKGTTRAASRAEAYALHRALIQIGQPHLAVVPLVCFEWHQRPENVLAGHLAWSDYRPSVRPNEVQVEHHKTGGTLWLALSDHDGDLFPDLSKYLDGLERLGVPVVLRKSPKKGAPATPFPLRYARKLVREAAKVAGLPNDLTLAACRHGGLTELGDAELTEQQSMALSGHKDPRAHRGYIKRTEKQRLAGARKRRSWLDSNAKAEQK